MKYYLTYKIETHPEGLDHSEIESLTKKDDDLGATQALFFASIMYPEDGGLSIMFGSLDGRTQEILADSEWFKVWCLLADRLAKSKTLDSGQKNLCRTVFETIREAILQAITHGPIAT